MPALKDAYTTQELMPVFGVSHESSITRRAKKEGWKDAGRIGLGGSYAWKFASMPQGAQLAIRTYEERKALAACEGIVAPDQINGIALSNAISGAILDDKRRHKALAKADLVGAYLDWQKKHGKTVAKKDAFIHAYLGGAWPELLKVFGDKVSWKSIERWKLEQARAGSVLALADKRGIAHKGRSILTEKHQVIILGQVLNPNAPTVGECVNKIQQRCVAEDIYVPSEATIRRYVNNYTKECFDEWTLWREGKKAWNDKCAISLLRDWSLVEVGDIVFADGHTLNFETLDPDTGKGKRMTLLLFFDGASNHPLGWEIMPTENVACISSAFRRTCLLLGKFPRVVYLDNGRAFRAKFFKGTPDLAQAGFAGLYRDLGCEVIHAWPYHGQTKTIERFFGTFHEMEVFVPSYTGNNIDRKPARMKRGEDLHRSLYDKMGGAPLTLEETHTAIAAWFCEYVQRPQYRTHLKGKSPAQVFNAGRGPGVDADRLTLMMLQKEVKTINKDGIRHMGRYYWHQALASRRHSVLIRYDELLSPFTILVYTPDGKFICEARDRTRFKIAAGLHPAARVLGDAEQQYDLSVAIELKREQEKLAGANMRQMLTAVVLPEAQKVQAGLKLSAVASEARKAVAAAPKAKALTSDEIKQIEAVKDLARADFDTNSPSQNEYKPAALMHFKDELDKYDYLFRLVHEQGVELITQDQAWMATFEASAAYQRNYKGRYDSYLELYAFREQQAQVI